MYISKKMKMRRHTALEALDSLQAESNDNIVGIR
jgi:hypothetical protein